MKFTVDITPEEFKELIGTKAIEDVVSSMFQSAIKETINQPTAFMTQFFEAFNTASNPTKK